jgi:hypothetical protein
MTPHSPVAGGAASPAQLTSAKSLLASRSTELSDVRGAAQKWQTGLAGIAGGITLFAIVKARTDLTGLRGAYPAIAGTLLAAGLALSVAGALAALRAAYGMPHLLRTSQLDIYTDNHSRAVSARRYLRAAVWCTVLSLAAFAACLAILWFAPLRGGPRLTVIPVQGDAACGTVSSLTGTYLTLSTSDGQQRFRLSQLRALNPVQSCR